MWRLAAYGSSGLEESAQDRDLEERVERHVVDICARASGSGRVSARASGQASLRAGEGLVGYGSGAAALAVRVSPCGLNLLACLVSRSLFFPTLFAESHASTPLQRVQGSKWGGLLPRTPRQHTSLLTRSPAQARRGVSRLVVSTCPSPTLKAHGTHRRRRQTPRVKHPTQRPTDGSHPGNP